MSDVDFRRLLDRFDLSWKGYRRVRKGVKKRLCRHMQALGLSRVEEYLAALASDPELKAECRLLLTVSISRFFRDRDLWRILDQEILPRFVQEETIKAWLAGCACGEEAYSLKIVHDRLSKCLASLPRLEILATDLSQAYLQRARAGIYQRSSLKEVPEELRPICFQKMPESGQYRVAEKLKTDLVWGQHDLLSGLSPGLFDIVFMRNNVLTYCKNGDQETAVRTAAASLKESGFLIIGSCEKLPPGHPQFRAFGRRPYILQKQAGGE